MTADSSKSKSSSANAPTTSTGTRTPDEQHDVVLVPPDGVHTPGNTAANAAEGQSLVEAPADAFNHPDAATAAYKAAQEGKAHKVSDAKIAHQNADGSALSPAEHADAEKREQEQQATYGDPTAEPDGVTK